MSKIHPEERTFARGAWKFGRADGTKGKGSRVFRACIESQVPYNINVVQDKAHLVAKLLNYMQ